MTNKIVVFLYGFNSGKAEFDRVSKDATLGNRWLWNVNHKNVLSVTAKELGWNDEKNDNYFEFIESLSELAEQHFGFQLEYYKRMIEKLNSHDKANMMVIHSADPTRLPEYKSEVGGYNVYIAKNIGDFNANVEKYDKVFIVDENFDKNVVQFLETLSK